ncbi:MAG: ribosome biogenesis GTPase Der, partial [Candidatus Subteraquimicrobiales bacterium]|nr:ribosome biogenesis GTPase Der [Candidatus Subteraquimicrobiales bacterium]
EEGHTLSKGGKSLKLSYLTQVKTKPPTFVFFVNHPEIVTSSYSAYLENRLRENFGFFGVPIRLRFKKKS